MSVTKLPNQTKALEWITVPFEMKQLDGEATDPDFFKFEGLASTFGNIDLVDDIVQAGAFLESLQKQTPVILWQHDRYEPIGMPEEVRENEQGLFLKGKLPRKDTFVSGRVIPQMEVGSIKSMSIGFRVREQNIDMDTGIRTIIKADLMEVSLVTFPANPLAAVSGFKSMVESIKGLELSGEEKKEFLSEIVKSLGGNHKPYTVEGVKDLTLREFEKVLRESGLFSKEAATVLASKSSLQGEPDEIKDAISALHNDIKQSESKSLLRSINQNLENL